MADQSFLLNQTWTDILAPAPPPSMALWLVLSGVVLLLLVVFVVFILWQQRPRQRAMRALAHSRRQLHAVSADTRRIAHAVHRALLQGLGLNPVTVANPCTAHEQQWQAFYRRLQQCVFQAAPPSVDDLNKLIQQGRYWLRHYPG